MKGYVDMRKIGHNSSKKVVTATPRQLESLIRLSEALARMRYSNVVTSSDVQEARRLMTVATQTVLMKIDCVSSPPSLSLALHLFCFVDIILLFHLLINFFIYQGCN